MPLSKRSTSHKEPTRRARRSTLVEQAMQYGKPIGHTVVKGARTFAVRAAVQMIEMIEGYSQERETLGKSPLRIGIGIAAGQVIAGYTGTQRRATYTCVGDTVNLAARLESHTKVVGKPILIDECVRMGLSDKFQVEN